jgi:hypothetical protein
MVTFSQPILATQEVVGLAKMKPSNIWVQGLVIEAVRVTRNDIPAVLPGITMLDVKQAYPNYYIPTQGLIFTTPLMKSPSNYVWDEFVKQIASADQMILDYNYGEKEHTDVPFSDRLFIKEVLLLELPKDDRRYRDYDLKYPYNPGNQDDAFYDKMPCAYATFQGTHQLLGASDSRNGIRPGYTHKVMNLVELERVKTKHIKMVQNKAVWRAFHRERVSRDVVSFDDLKALSRDDCLATVRHYLPECCQMGIIKQLEFEGDWENLPRFKCSTMSVDSIMAEAA